MSLIVTIKNRNFTGNLLLPDYQFSVNRYSFSAQGGPQQAEIAVDGEDFDLWRLVELIRCPIEIRTAGGQMVWWGYIAETQAHIGGFKVGATVDTMFNRIAVAYNEVDETTGDQERGTTEWVDGIISQFDYGVKEMLISNSGSTLEHTEYARDVKLKQVQFPQALIIPESNVEKGGLLVCRGWFETLGWKYYQNLGVNLVDTATQIGTICASKGQFFASVHVEDISGISIPETRDGDGTALYEVLELLKMGTSNYQRLMALVDENRNLRIFEEPSDNPFYKLYADGHLEDYYASPVDKQICPVGVWARWIDVIPPAVDTSLLAEPSKIFIEESEYDVLADTLTLTPRGMLDPFNFMEVKDG